MISGEAAAPLAFEGDLVGFDSCVARGAYFFGDLDPSCSV